MVQEYTERCYLPSHRRFAQLTGRRPPGGQGLAAWRRRVAGHWGQVQVESVEAPTGETLRVGGEFQVQGPRATSGASRPDDVEVQLFHGVLDSMGEIAEPRATPHARRRFANGSDGWLFTGNVPVPRQRPVRLRRPRAARSTRTCRTPSSRAW